MSKTTTESCYVLERLAIDHRLLGFQRAVAVTESHGKELRWWITVFDADTEQLEDLRHEVDVRATARDGTRLAGRAVTDCVTPACHFIGFRGAGPLLIG